MRFQARPIPMALVAAALAVACGSSDNGGGAEPTNVGGASGATGGAASNNPSTGGQLSTSASSSVGGSATGGAPGLGGATGAGGSRTGGTPGTGGVTPTGGTRSTGGAATTGGSLSTGGTTNKASTATTGGTLSLGGTSSSTGGAGVAGALNTGGRATGGASAATGGRSTGGASTGAATGGAGGGSTAFMPCPTTAGTACAIMPVGDSITEGCCTAPMGGYRIELYHQALTNKKNITFVGTLSNGPATVDGQTFPKLHEGHGGWKIAQIAGVIDAAIKTSKPHIVLLKIGTNDINGNDDVANAPNRLASLIDQITKDVPSALLVVSSIIPSTTDGTNTRFQTYNTGVKAKAEAAAAAGKHVVFVDNYQPFAQTANFKTALMSDNLHPNTAGYVVLGKSFYNVVSALLPAAP